MFREGVGTPGSRGATAAVQGAASPSVCARELPYGLGSSCHLPAQNGDPMASEVVIDSARAGAGWIFLAYRTGPKRPPT
jgi:hypothetical protein